MTQSIRDQLGSEAPDLVAAFASHHHGSALEQLGPRLGRALGARFVLGCTGEGIIGGDREVEREPALSVWAARLPETHITPFTTQAEPGPDGEAVFTELPPVRDPAAASVLLFADPFSFPMDEYLKLLNRQLAGVPAVGGMASGGMGPGQNLLFTADGLVESGAIGAVLEGGVELCAIVSQGCRPVGRPWVVTGCQDYLLRSLGGRPALDVLVETLEGLEARDRELFQRHPFIGMAFDSTKSSYEHGDFLVRGILGIQAQEKALAVNEALRKGMTVQFLVRDAQSASDDLTRLVSNRAVGPTAAPGNQLGALLFSCNGRGTRMFSQSDHDVRCVRTSLSRDLPVAGFFAMGEIGPVGGRNFLHGFTASLALFRPKQDKLANE